MSLFSANIIKNAKEYFGEDADIGFREYGYLLLGSRDTAETQRRNALMQRKHGASIDILTPDETTKLYPWLNLDDIGIPTYGNTKDGWLDAWALFQLVRREAQKLGAKYVNGKAVTIVYRIEKPSG